jgi:hypothetical protein
VLPKLVPARVTEEAFAVYGKLVGSMLVMTGASYLKIAAVVAPTPFKRTTAPSPAPVPAPTRHEIFVGVM